ITMGSPAAHLVFYTVLLGCLAAAWECPDNGLFADPHNCQWYYNCANGLAFHSICPDGTLYDVRQKHCDWARNIDCRPAAVPTDAPPSPFGCPVGYSEVAGNCYYFSKLHGLPRMSWSDARNFCQSMSYVNYTVDLAVMGNFSAPQDDPVLNYMSVQ
ncbi:unnamed protein product, partial [Meganyctiphanes norvegica]